MSDRTRRKLAIDMWNSSKGLVGTSHQQKEKFLTEKIVEGAIITMKWLIDAFYHSVFDGIGGNSLRTIDYIPSLSVRIWIWRILMIRCDDSVDTGRLRTSVNNRCDQLWDAIVYPAFYLPYCFTLKRIYIYVGERFLENSLKTGRERSRLRHRKRYSVSYSVKGCS